MHRAMPSVSVAHLANIPVSAALVHAALDCIAHLADLDPLRPDRLRMIARALGTQALEGDALTLRLLAFAAVLNDDRWPAWVRLYRQLSAERRRTFDRRLAIMVACHPLDARGRLSAYAFYDGLLDVTAGSGDPQSFVAAVWPMPPQ